MYWELIIILIIFCIIFLSFIMFLFITYKKYETWEKTFNILKIYFIKVKNILNKDLTTISIFIYLLIICTIAAYSIYYIKYIIKNLRFLNYNLFFNSEQVANLNNLSRYCNPFIEYFGNNTIIEGYDNPDKEDLKKIGGIPVSFYNKNINAYQDLIVSDFYWAASYKSYLSGSATYGIPKLESLKININDYNMTFLNLDLYSSEKTPNHPNAIPIVRSEVLAHTATPLVFKECLYTIKRSWQNNATGGISPPLFLYLTLNFKNDITLCNRIKNDLVVVFKNMFVDKVHSFVGRQEKFPISEAKIKDILGKVIIITDVYPTRSSLDEYIHSSTTEQYHKTNKIEYTADYLEYDGIKVNNNINQLITNNKKNISIVYASGKKEKSTKALFNSKLDIINPDFMDCAKYGLQIVMMSPMLHNKYMHDWVLFFNKRSMQLKPKSLRWIQDKKLVVKKQDNRLTYKPTTVQLIPQFAKHNSSGFVPTKYIS